MKAALLRRIGQLEVRRPAPADSPRGGVLVSVEAAALCRSDVKMVRQGQRDLVLPRILGHEAAGTVIASDHPDWQPGTRVALYPASLLRAMPRMPLGSITPAAGNSASSASTRTASSAA